MNPSRIRAPPTRLAADALKKLLDAAPGVKVVHLNSIGGRVGEGYQIYQIVRDRKLATYTATDCVSACTIAFLGGSQRYLSSKARLGFHSISFGGVDQKQLPDINADLRRMLAFRIGEGVAAELREPDRWRRRRRGRWWLRRRSASAASRQQKQHPNRRNRCSPNSLHASHPSEL